jgi:hypothetical protein
MAGPGETGGAGSTAEKGRIEPSPVSTLSREAHRPGDVVD